MGMPSVAVRFFQVREDRQECLSYNGRACSMLPGAASLVWNPGSKWSRDPYFRRKGMLNLSKWNGATQRVLLAMAVLVLAGWFAGPARSQQPAKGGAIYAVIHVDSVPTDAASVSKQLQQYAVDSRKDKGAVRIEVYVQADRPNHFSIVEEWADQQAYDAHVAAAHTKKFREGIQASLGSPFDERLHKLLE